MAAKEAKKPGVERIKILGYRQWRHEIAPDKANQTFHFGLIVSLPRSPKAVFKQVMAL